MLKKENLKRNLYKILGTVALVFYIAFLIGRGNRAHRSDIIRGYFSVPVICPVLSSLLLPLEG